MTMHRVLGLAAWLAVSFAAATVGAIASVDAASFYAGLSQPSWAPPAGVFGPVWTVLYALMGISAWLVWSRTGLGGGKLPLALFVVQLAVNALWSWLFFAAHRGALAFVDVVVLWILIVATTRAFWRVRPLAGVLLLPYLAWVSFASMLTLVVWQRNPELLG